MLPSTALITGASAGLGVEFAHLLAKDHNNVVLVARSEDKLQQLAADLEKRYGIKAHVFASDLSLPGAAQALVESLRLADLKIDVLINNAGFGTNGKFHENPAEQEFAMLQVNVVALAQLTRLLLPFDNGWGI